jgi:hypothetical protein
MCILYSLDSFSAELAYFCHKQPHYQYIPALALHAVKPLFLYLTTLSTWCSAVGKYLVLSFDQHQFTRRSPQFGGRRIPHS